MSTQEKIQQDREKRSESIKCALCWAVCWAGTAYIGAHVLAAKFMGRF